MLGGEATYKQDISRRTCFLMPLVAGSSDSVEFDSYQLFIMIMNAASRSNHDTERENGWVLAGPPYN